MEAGDHHYEVWWRDGTAIQAPMFKTECPDYAAALIEYDKHAQNSWHSVYALVCVEVVKGAPEE